MKKKNINSSRYHFVVLCQPTFIITMQNSKTLITSVITQVIMAFQCQNCKAPIALDETLSNLSKAQTHYLLGRSGKPSHHVPLSPANYIPQDRLNLAHKALQDANDDAIITQDYSKLSYSNSFDSQKSYVFLSDGEDEDEDGHETEDVKGAGEGQTEEQLPDFSKISSLNQVFHILSTNEDVNHPMCGECAHLLASNYKLKFDQSQREKESYLGFLKKLKETEASLASAATDSTLDAKLGESHAEFVQLKTLEEEKLKELQDLEAKYDELVGQLAELDLELKRLNSHELNDIIKLKNSLSLELLLKQNKLDQAKALYQKHLNHLDQLRALNIYTKLFEISFDKEDNYARINGYRLGYKVAWPEVNVALGQVVLLLSFLKKRFLLTLDSYKLVPMGSKSYVVKKGVSSNDETGERTKTSSVLQLYSSNEFTLGKLFNFNKLDVSMIALLDILSQFETNLMAIDEDLELPYKIASKHDMIGGKSIRVTSNGQWTESCRYLLIDLNWVLTYASTMS